jgi:uncharacterized protein YndB with AHSA1/START domain
LGIRIFGNTNLGGFSKQNQKTTKKYLLFMDNQVKEITVEAMVHASVEKVWKLWTTPADIMQWNNPFDNWHSPKVKIDLRDGGNFLFRMEAKDGSVGFDHTGKYDTVKKNELIEYTVSDGRKSIIQFIKEGDSTSIIEIFQPEKETPVEIQRDFVQSILNSFKKYAENQG